MYNRYIPRVSKYVCFIHCNVCPEPGLFLSQTRLSRVMIIWYTMSMRIKTEPDEYSLCRRQYGSIQRLQRVWGQWDYVSRVDPPSLHSKQQVRHTSGHTLTHCSPSTHCPSSRPCDDISSPESDNAMLRSDISNSLPLWKSLDLSRLSPHLCTHNLRHKPLNCPPCPQGGSRHKIILALLSDMREVEQIFNQWGPCISELFFGQWSEMLNYYPERHQDNTVLQRSPRPAPGTRSSAANQSRVSWHLTNQRPGQGRHEPL